jgi:hypothetical protein
MTLTETPLTEIDLHHRVNCPKLFARLVWQVLFNEYREFGGKLERMDNLLCDYDLLQTYFGGWFKTYGERGLHLRWSFGGDITDLEPESEYCSPLDSEWIDIRFDPQAFKVYFSRCERK